MRHPSVRGKPDLGMSARQASPSQAREVPFAGAHPPILGDPRERSLTQGARSRKYTPLRGTLASQPTIGASLAPSRKPRTGPAFPQHLELLALLRPAAASRGAEARIGPEAANRHRHFRQLGLTNWAKSAEITGCRGRLGFSEPICAGAPPAGCLTRRGCSTHFAQPPQPPWRIFGPFFSRSRRTIPIISAAPNHSGEWFRGPHGDWRPWCCCVCCRGR
jgi:hypothetical protein